MSVAEFGEQLRRHRRRRGLTQEELAERAGLSPAVISRLERGLTRAPQKFTLRALSAALDLAADEAAAFAKAARRSARPEGDAHPGAAPPAREPRAMGQLAVPLTPLIGRERDVHALVEVLAGSATRLLTLTGPAGVGKSRLAVHVAALLRDQRAHEVAFVGLIPIQEPGRVPAAIAEALGLRETGTTPPLETLISSLRERRVTLVLDNFEHVLPAARGVLEVLVACPGVKALVTSRAALNVRGERCYPVAPLALPDRAQWDALDDLRRVPTVALFLERVAAADPAVAVTSLEEGRLVADMCRRLDGLPLAIELAAARVRHLGLHQLHDRLARPALLGTLGEGPRDLADHQRTMRSTIAWSYDLLNDQERRLFRSLGVVVADASLEAIVAVSRMDEETVVAGLTTLLDASLLQCADAGGLRRYAQLVTVRAYAQERLQAEGEWEEARRRCAAYFAELVGMLVPGGDQQHERIMPLVEAEYDNIRSALAWALETGATEQGLRMVGALRRFWGSHAHHLEGLEWLERFIARAEAAGTDEEREVLAEAWTGVLVMCHRLDRFARAREAGETALALRREIGDPRQIAAAMQNLANPLVQLREVERAQALYEECLTLYERMNDRQGKVFPLMNLGELHALSGQPQRALDLYHESLRLSHELDESEWARGLTWNNVGEAHIALDEPARAVEVTEPNYRMFIREHDVYCTATCAFTLGRAHWRLGDAETARAYLDEAERLFRTLGNLVAAARVQYVRASLALEDGAIPEARHDLAHALVDLAGQSQGGAHLWWLIERAGTLACREGDPQTAARLYGAAAARRDAAQGLCEPAEREMCLRDLGRLRDQLGERELTACLDAGREMDHATVVALLRAVLSAEGMPAVAPARPSRHADGIP